MITTAAADAWEQYQASVVRTGDFSRWPNEAMLKVLSGNYLGERRVPAAGERVLDVGCGMGQNLVSIRSTGLRFSRCRID